MDEEKKVFPETEPDSVEMIPKEEIVTTENEVTDTPIEEETPVTEADVIAAFNEASKSLGLNSENNIEPIEEVDAEPTAEENELDAIMIERNNYVKQFQMDFSLDDIPDAAGMGCMEDTAEGTTEPAVETAPEEVAAETVADAEPIKDEPPLNTAEPAKSRGCLLRIIFTLLILLVSVALAAVVTTAVFDITGFNRNNKVADVVIPKGADTEKVAAILKEEGMINSELCFRLYCRFMNLDGKWQAGSFSLQADMGFPTLINTMQAKPPRKTVMVTFPEGLTVPEMAAILEEKKVCTAESFISAVKYGDYDYDFVRDIPTEADDPEYAYRAYRLEGYLFPDTYEFYVGSLGETVVDRMLQNFEAKISKAMLAQIKNNGWTLDQAVIMASMVQGEGDTRENMDKVSRVMQNRLEPDSGFTMFQFCSTHDYANYLLELKLDSYDAQTLHQAYNTCTHEELSVGREGLPVGAINNPGLDAFNAVLYPSVDKDIMESYYFITDKDGITRFAKTIEEHNANIKKYGLSE